MTIGGFTIPTLLESHLTSGGGRLTEHGLARLKVLLNHIEVPRPRLWAYEQIISQHKLWSSPAATAYLGTDGTGFQPGLIEPARTLIIGEAETDSPIALDHRSDNPPVIYLGDAARKTVWIEIAPNYEAFIDKLIS